MQEIGPLVDTQEEASRIGAEMAAALLAQSRGAPKTLGRAILRIQEQELELGSPEASVKGVYENPGNAITSRYLGPDTQMLKIKKEHVTFLIDEALGDRIAPVTVRRCLRVLDRAFEAAELPSPDGAGIRARQKALRVSGNGKKRDLLPSDNYTDPSCCLI